MPFCPSCGKEVGEGAKFCPNCGQRLEKGFTSEEREGHIQEPEESRKATPENTSGQGDSAIVPEAVKGWNWGGFALTWIWGVCNKVWISLLVFIPFPLFGLAWAIVLGVKGNEWAWRSKKWDSIEQFKSTQGKWNTAGIVLFVIYIVVVVTLVVTFVVFP